MGKSVALTNQKLVERLRSGDDLEAVNSALDRGEITFRQAKNITKWIRSRETIRENYRYTAVVFDDASGQWVGEVVSKNRGASWIGKRYGQKYPRDSAEFTGQALCPAVTETKARNTVVPAEEIEIEEEQGAVRVWRVRFVKKVLDTRKPSTAHTEFTPEQWERIRAHTRARGMTFEVFLPESLATWLREKIAAGVFKDAAEAAFVAFQDLQELDRHPEVRKHLLRAMLEASLKDPRPRIPIEEVRARHHAQLREWANTEPPAT